MLSNVLQCLLQILRFTIASKIYSWNKICNFEHYFAVHNTVVIHYLALRNAAQKHLFKDLRPAARPVVGLIKTKLVFVEYIRTLFIAKYLLMQIFLTAAHLSTVLTRSCVMKVSGLTQVALLTGKTTLEM